jgi:hypothetical protein
VLGGASGGVSNSRVLEIIPRIDAAVLAPSSPPGVQTLTVAGTRLNGSDVRLLLDGVVYQAAPNANPSQLSIELARALSAGTHQLSVAIDGHASHDVALEA